MTHSPRRILRVIARMNVGGPARQVAGLMRTLPDLGWQQLLATGVCSDDERDYLATVATDVEATVVPTLGRAVAPVSDLRARRTLARIGREFRPDLVHTHTFKAGALMRTPPRPVPGAAHVHTFHGHLLHGYAGPRVSSALARYEAMLARRSDALMVVGSRVREELLAAGIGDPATTFACRPGVEPLPRVERGEARQRLGIPDGRPVVVWIGRFSPVKDPMAALMACQRIAERVDGTIGLMVGGGELFDQVRARADAGAADVRLPGWVDDVASVLAAADVVILTSRNEGVPITLVEATSAGRPAVSLDVGSVADIPGVTVVEDMRALVVAVTTLLETGPADLAGVARRSRALFSTEALAERMDGVYRFALGAGPAPDVRLAGVA